MRQILLFLFLFSSSLLQASINEFSDSPLHLKLSADAPGFDLHFKSKADSQKIVKFQPHVTGRVGVEVFLRGFIGLGYSFSTPQKSEESFKKGSTGYDDIRFSVAFKKYHFFLNYQRYSGFYIENSSEVDSSWSSNSPFLNQPQLKLKNISVNFTFLHSPEKFSLISSLDQVERQESSGGSWLYGVALTETEFSNTQTIIPTNYKSEFGRDQNLILGKFQALNLKIGYGYTQVWKKNWFLSGVFMLGGGLQKRDYKTTDFNKSDIVTGTSKVDLIISTGYNGETHSGGVSLSADATNYSTQDISVDSSLWSSKFFYGRRF